jgi:hypothetical protein
MGYITEIYEATVGHSVDTGGDTIAFGFLLLLAPIFAPLYWLGRLGVHLYE